MCALSQAGGSCYSGATAVVHASSPFHAYMTDPLKTDEFSGKGAVEQDRPEQPTNTSLAGQIGHRHKDAIVDTKDTDFPEPGESPEHSGELMEQKSPDQHNQRERLERDADQVQDEVDQQPGDRQRRNQNEQEDDPLAA